MEPIGRRRDTSAGTRGAQCAAAFGGPDPRRPRYRAGLVRLILTRPLPSRAAQMQSTTRVYATKVFPELTDRECEVLELVSAGLGNHEIAPTTGLVGEDSPQPRLGDHDEAAHPGPSKHGGGGAGRRDWRVLAGLTVCEQAIRSDAGGLVNALSSRDYPGTVRIPSCRSRCRRYRRAV